jgi:hypothetical protein
MQEMALASLNAGYEAAYTTIPNLRRLVVGQLVSSPLRDLAGEGT